MTQELCVPSLGFISGLVWLKLDDCDDSAFAFGASDGNIHIYECGTDTSVFQYLNITIAHMGAIESLAWDPIHRQVASTGNGHPQVWKLSADSL